ncbi:hypothetical protein LBMAG21_05780 [Armatimonadota bacterium]|nr:hypothetical protein LBMAG21_05780 [Armatimonadota bacterium]
MNFRYLKDPLFLLCVVLYFVNRFVFKPLIHGGIIGAIVHGSVNDLICLPFWIPIMLWMMQRLGWRTSDKPPQAAEILLPLLCWSWYFEMILPKVAYFKRVAFSDPNDILCYTIGACVAALFWNYYYSLPSKTATSENI